MADQQNQNPNQNISNQGRTASPPPNLPGQGLPPLPPAQSNPSGTQDDSRADVLKSSIRTLETDRGALSSGKKVAGQVFTRTPSPELPKPVSPILPPSPTRPTPPPAPKNFDVELGQARKSRALSSPSGPTLKSDVVSVKAIPPLKASPASGSGRSKRWLLWLLIGVVIALGIWGYFRFFADSTPVVVETPTPTPIQFPEGAIIINSNINPAVSLQTAVQNLSLPASNSFTLHSVYSDQGNQLNWNRFVQRFVLGAPFSLADATQGRYPKVLVYGQTESFDETVVPRKVIGLAIKVQDSPEFRAGLREWELGSLVSDFQPLFGLNVLKADETFQDNSYKETVIRFRNFSRPDRSIDYAVVIRPSLSQDQPESAYLIIMSSRQSTFDFIDQLETISPLLE
ncbi:MAG: hypothetical protein COV31_02710 [Candidatus Yanofskybacteria bacterium CG10_big_fil_rev_8_21_14_0_10_46_23]|uniref:Uncharacterized protein n=1 Tax=Candidatus Yanofskybacteria bacterium CG10_big_fil_rev_8_21_14_0_10_46_23 TaxID=1975098 RepID=A0A2H0R432_9BACT|nr:MAG: hypothetical protein COV31_02710 [Candidatus Yanofskybacteria bacterium CG10_big_fil_rev_8_21_14_0_10_46_23]